MAERLRLALAQLNLLVGDVAGNVGKMIAAAQRARDELQAHAVVFPELALTGYPPEDLLLRPDLTARVETGLGELMAATRGIDLITGYPRRQYGNLYNAAVLLRDGQFQSVYYKHCLPNYSVFDEKRYFAEGTGACVARIRGVPVGLTVCEDVWEGSPVDEAVGAGAQLIVNLNASPYHRNKHLERYNVVGGAARRNRVPVVYVNLVGGQDELVEIVPERSEEDSVYEALVLGVRDYVEKNGFNGVVIGLSGGIDSALTLCVAVDALGPERVQAVMMPSRFTASISLEDAKAQAAALGVNYSVIPIEPMFEAFLAALAGEFKGMARDTTEENIQARVRGVLLMAISNKTGRMVLTTGNKSEMAVGYATLYGDMAGGFAAIKDVPKTLVYRLAAYRNARGAVIPHRVMERPPSAELAPDQKDTDSLPPYAVLDPILERYVEQDQSAAEIVAAGFDETTVRRVLRMVDRNEYKRRQAPPGVRITPRGFGRDRRYPITSGYGRG